MLKILGIIAAVLVVAIVGILIAAAMRPDTFRVQRSIAIKAPPAKIFAFINDYRQWTAWSPYEKLDPAMKRTFAGPASGRGSKYAWQGNKNVGEGSMEVLESTPPSKILIKLDFVKPFEAHNTAEFTFVPSGDTTTVTWAMVGPVPFFFKIVHLFMNVDKMVGGQFEEGLRDLKAAAEK